MKTDLLITRHAVQELLRVAAVQSTPTCGLLCGQNGVIQSVHPFNHNHTVRPSPTNYERSMESNVMNPLAWYVSITSHAADIDILRSKVIHMCSAAGMNASTRMRELPMVVIHLDIKGRIEVALLDKENGAELPLLLEEDGQAIPHAG